MSVSPPGLSRPPIMGVGRCGGVKSRLKCGQRIVAEKLNLWESRKRNPPVACATVKTSGGAGKVK